MIKTPWFKQVKVNDREKTRDDKSSVKNEKRRARDQEATAEEKGTETESSNPATTAEPVVATKVAEKKKWFSIRKAVAPTETVARPTRDVVTESLSAIYEGRPTREWMNTLDRGRRKTWIIFFGTFASLIVIAALAAWVGFFFFGGRGFNGQGISIQVEGTDRVSIGREMTYYVNWYNIAKEPLASLEFRVSFPTDFLATEITPNPVDAADQRVVGTPKTLTFRLGAQSVEGRGTVKIKGRFTGALGTKSAIQVISTYRPASFNSEFETLVTKELVYAESILAGSVLVPEKVVPGDLFTVQYRVENTGSEPMDGLAARMMFPDGFIAASGTSGMIEGLQPVFTIGTLEPGASSTVSIRGSFALGTHGNQTFRAEAGIVSSDGTFASAQSSEKPVSVLAGDLKIDLVVNGAQADRSVNAGDLQRVTIAYQNTSDEPLKDIAFTFNLSGTSPSGTSDVTIVDWSGLEDELEGTRKGNTLAYTEEEIEGLAELAPNAEGTIEFSVPVRSTVKLEEDVPMSAFVEARIGAVGTVKVNRVVKTSPITLRLRSDARISAVARYTSEEGVQLGSGPLPPVAGSSTRYRIEWTIAKSLHELSRLTVSASIPDGIAFGSVKEVGAGEIAYDPEKKLITWEVNRMPEGTGDLFSSFDVILLPSEADIGRFAKLLGETRFEFTDVALGETVLRTSGALTTELPDDPMAKKKGVVTR